MNPQGATSPRPNPTVVTSHLGETLATPPPAISEPNPSAVPQAAGCEPSMISPTATNNRSKPRMLPSPSGETLATPPPATAAPNPSSFAQAAGCEPSMISPTATKLPAKPTKLPSPSGETLVIPPPATPASLPSIRARAAEYDALNLSLIVLAENLHDIEQTRLAMGNRVRQLAELDTGSGDIEVLAGIADGMAKLEHQVVLRLQRAMRAHPLGPWVKRSKGVGEKQAARLLAAIGNPYWNSLHDRPRRGPAELWAYCGYHVLPAAGQSLLDSQLTFAGGGQPSATPTDQNGAGTQWLTVGGVAPKRRKGQRANWNSNARTRAYLVADSCMKSPGGQYRAVYDHGRAKYAESPAGLAHNRALRLVAKAVLRDIYLEAKAWHQADA